jgi:predicted deacetylase
MAVHVSIHDVSPAWEREVEDALALCARFGVKPALLVVPDFHGRAPLGEHPAYAARLRQLEAAGHEVYLHGFYHRSRPYSGAAADVSTEGSAGAHEQLASDAAGRPRGLRWLFAQKVVSGGEAEFSDVSPVEAVERLDAGRRVLEAAGLAPVGFVPPAWSMPGWVMPLLAERGYRYTEDHLNIHDPVSGRSRKSVVLNFASRTLSRKVSSVAWCRLARPARRFLPARIALHPGDMRSAWLRREAERLLAWAAGDFVATGAELHSA